MTTVTMVPLEVYLNTMYKPDCDYIDGEVRERNLGEQPHSTIQKFFIQFLGNRDKQWDIRLFPEQRVQVGTENYRVADICVARRSVKFEPIVYTPPLLCIEVVSREDRRGNVREVVEDYIRMGVQTVWVVDPRKHRCEVADRSTTLQVESSTLTVYGTEIEVPVAEVFRELDELQNS